MNKTYDSIRFKILSAFAAFLIIGSYAAYPEQQPPQKKSQYMKVLSVDIPDFPAEGLILDIGGGGEGVIGQLKKDALNHFMEELLIILIKEIGIMQF